MLHFLWLCVQAVMVFYGILGTIGFGIAGIVLLFWLLMSLFRKLS